MEWSPAAHGRPFRRKHNRVAAPLSGIPGWPHTATATRGGTNLLLPVKLWPAVWGLGAGGRGWTAIPSLRPLCPIRVFAYPHPSPISRVSLAGPSSLRSIRFSTGFGTPGFLVFFFLWSILVGFLCDFFQGGFLLFSVSFSIFLFTIYIFRFLFIFLFYLKISNISIFISFKFEQI
jgi:hypothetical protein